MRRYRREILVLDRGRIRDVHRVVRIENDACGEWSSSPPPRSKTLGRRSLGESSITIQTRRMVTGALCRLYFLKYRPCWREMHAHGCISSRAFIRYPRSNCIICIYFPILLSGCVDAREGGIKCFSRKTAVHMFNFNTQYVCVVRNIINFSLDRC